MITPIVRLAQAVEDTKRAHAEIEAEELLGHLNRVHQNKALQYAAEQNNSPLYTKHLQKISVDRTVSRVRKRVHSRFLERA
jgi:cobalamin biosynthesis protein CbiD